MAQHLNHRELAMDDCTPRIAQVREMLKGCTDKERGHC